MNNPLAAILISVLLASRPLSACESGPLTRGGGALDCTLINCTLTDNSAIAGGATADCTLYNCVLSGNSGGGFVCGGGGGGGAAADCTLYHCVLTLNWAGVGGGGGASRCKLYNCTLSGNSATGASSGGGGASECTLYNCELSGNFAANNVTGDGISGGGALSCTLYNCTLTRNVVVWGQGGGASGCTLYNCTLSDNSADWGRGGVLDCSLYNGIVYYNAPDNGGGTFNYCCTTPLPTNGVGNIIGPPLFVDIVAGNFRLREDSPCIDAGTNLVGLAFTDPNTGELVTYAYDATDILGNTRFIDGNGDGKVTWDMGAYEFNSFRPPRFSIAPQLTLDGWKLNVTGAANQWTRLQRSSDLKNWEDDWYVSDQEGNEFLWSPSPVLLDAGGIGQFRDIDSRPRVMFYRVVVR